MVAFINFTIILFKKSAFKLNLTNRILHFPSYLDNVAYRFHFTVTLVEKYFNEKAMIHASIYI